ncbi:uncharacterized protein KD926_004393 [Aspergillus affinis]|uniref:uncharacterized protein n=1 Tax=Aspergillus affinis TaxID=1070780 RepID=UPI0022FF09F1|nr:uncharacterized protein KD926_004393 [Aspergillus affinis]KAI9043209.1 hypothetical protein KD926_004393 [Aspergillus affinis]
MSDDVKQVFADAVKATKGLNKLPYGDRGLQDLQACVDRAPTYPEDDPDPGHWAIDIFAIADLLTKLMFPSVANGIASLESNDDPQNFQWSNTLWAEARGKGDPDQMDSIVRFCGRVASFDMCLLDAITGFQVPAKTFTVTKAFYEMSETGSGARAVADDVSCYNEGQYGLVGDNRPVRDEACGLHTPLMVSGFLPETPIALADGSSRPVEDLRSGVQCWLLITRKNGQSPCIPASQVFQTTTGPRAVDVKGARRFNPYRHIGQLAVGHMLFRVEGQEWITVEIKSIDQDKVPPSELTHTLALAAEHQTYHAHGYVVETNAPCHTPGKTRWRLRQRLNWELFGQYNSSEGNHPVSWNSIASLSFRDWVNLRKAHEVPKGVAIERLKRNFSLDAHAPDRLPAGYELPTLTLLVDGYFMVDDDVQLRSTYDPRQRSIQWARLFEHGVVEIYSHATAGRGAIYLSSESEPQKTLCRDQTHSFEAQGRSLNSRLTSTRRAADDDIDIPGVRLPALDDLRDKINQKYGQHLGDLYQVVGKLYSSNETYESYDLYNKTFDVGFSDLDIDVTIPALFQEVTLKLDDSDIFDDKITGYFFEYDPTKRENKGNRHLVKGTLKDDSAVQACRSKISQAYAAITRPGQIDTVANERLRPARITETLPSSTALSIKDLINLAGYDEKSVLNKTQTLIKEMMLYQMNGDQREKILHKPRPDKDFPASLAGNLPQKLKVIFKNKYAPAFICRYVGRTSSYMNDFTEKEMNNLWYWWQGNGKNSLSQSEEYNDINRLVSWEAMFRMNKEKLEPYRADNPDNWAEQLYTFLLNNPRQLRKWAHFPIDDSVSTVSSPSYPLSPMFEATSSMLTCHSFFGIPSTHGYTIPYPSISSDVEAALRGQIEEFEKQNNLNQQADAEQRAAAILDKSATFMKEIAGSRPLAIASPEALVQLPSHTNNQADQLIAYQVGMTLAVAAVNLWSLVKSWDAMSDSQRTDVIIQVIRKVADDVDKALNAFKSFHQSLTEEIMENGETMDEVAEKIAGDEDYRVAIADGLHSEGATTAPEGEETWNEDLNAIADDIPLSYEEAAKRFNWSGKLLRVFNAIPGLGLVVATSFSLANDWNSLSDPGKVLGVLNVVVQGLTVLLDMIEVGSDIGLWAVTETMSVALPILGAVLAVVGIVLVIVQVLINFFMGTKPPPDPIADFIEEEAYGRLIDTFDTASSPQLSYTISDLKVTAGQVKTITIKGENKSSDDVTVSNAVITLYSGDDSACLFSNGADETENIQLVDDSDSNHDSDGYTYVTPADTTAAQFPTPGRLGNTSAYYGYDLQMAGPPATSTKLKELVVKACEYFESIWTAKINKKGDSDDSSVSGIEIVENGLKDRCQVQFALQRV